MAKTGGAVTTGGNPGPEPLSSFDMLWGPNKRPARGPKPELTLERIVTAGLEVADAEGLAAVTMSRVAEQLGVTTMALYRYVPAKAQLIDLMTDGALGAAPQAGGGNWRAELSQWARASFAVIQKHPWLMETVMARISVGPNWVTWLESALQALRRVNLSVKERTAAVLAIDGHVRSSAQISIGAPGSAEWATNFQKVLELVRNDERYRALGEVVAGGGFDNSGTDEGAFEFGLQRLLDGIEGFSAARQRQRLRRKPGAAPG